MNGPVESAARPVSARAAGAAAAVAMAWLALGCAAPAAARAADEWSLAPAALAASDVVTPPRVGEEGATLQVSFGGIADSDVGDEGAAYGMNWTAVELGLGSLRSSLTVMNFEWDHPERFMQRPDGKDPWDRLYQLNVGWTHRGMMSERAMYELIIGAVSSFERQLADSHAGYAGGYAVYAVDERWTLTAGALYSRHAKVSTQFDFLPIVGVMWNQQAASGLSFAIGFPSTDLTWRFNEKASLRLEISSIEGGIYRLADRAEAPQEAYVEFRSTTAMLRFDAEVGNRVTVHVGISRALDRELRLYDRQGSALDKQAVEERIGVSAGASWAFGAR